MTILRELDLQKTNSWILSVFPTKPLCLNILAAADDVPQRSAHLQYERWARVTDEFSRARVGAPTRQRCQNPKEGRAKEYPVST